MHSIVLYFCFCVSLSYSLFVLLCFFHFFSPLIYFAFFNYYNFPLFPPLFLYSLLLWSHSWLSLVLSFPFIVFHSCSSASLIFLLIVFLFYLVSLTCLNLSFSVSPTFYSILALFCLVHSLYNFLPPLPSLPPSGSSLSPLSIFHCPFFFIFIFSFFFYSFFVN